MPTSQELIRNLNQKAHVQINGDLIRNTIGNLLSKTNDQQMREENIRKFITNTYSQIAEEFERRRAEGMLTSSDTASKTTSYEFFTGYVNIVSEIAKESSAQLLIQVETEKEDLKRVVANARKAYEDAKKELETRQNNYKARHNGSLEGIEDISDYKKYKDDVEIANIKLENALERQEQGVNSIDAFEPTPYFGMSAKTAKSLLEKQIKTCNYMDLRREQIERFGFKSNSYVLEIENANIPEDVTYKTATVEQKRKMQEIYATKQIMQEKLERRTTGAFAWIKKWWYRKDISALNNYLFAANLKLNGAKFDTDDAAEAMDAMTEKGFFHYEYEASGAEAILDEQLAKKAELKEASDNKEIEEAKNDAVSQLSDANKEKEIEATAKKDPASQMLDVYFRPSADSDHLKKQIAIANELGQKFKKGEISLDSKSKSVFNINMKKLKAMKEHYNKFADPKFKRSNEIIKENYDKVIAEFDKAESEFISQNPDYVPVNIESVQMSAPKRESISNVVAEDVKEALVNTEVSQPVLDNEPVKKNEEIAIN